MASYTPLCNSFLPRPVRSSSISVSNQQPDNFSNLSSDNILSRHQELLRSFLPQSVYSSNSTYHQEAPTNERGHIRSQKSSFYQKTESEDATSELDQILARNSHKERSLPNRDQYRSQNPKYMGKENNCESTFQSLDRTLDFDSFKKDHDKRVTQAIKEIMDYKPERTVTKSSPPQKQRHMDTNRILNDITNCVNDMKKLSTRKASPQCVKRMDTSDESCGADHETYKNVMPTKNIREEYHDESQASLIHYDLPENDYYQNNTSQRSRNSVSVSEHPVRNSVPNLAIQKSEDTYDNGSQDKYSLTMRRSINKENDYQHNFNGARSLGGDAHNILKPNIPKSVKKDSTAKRNIANNVVQAIASKEYFDVSSRDQIQNTVNYSNKENNNFKEQATFNNNINNEKAILNLIRDALNTENVSNYTEDAMHTLTKALMTIIKMVPKNKITQSKESMFSANPDIIKATVSNSTKQIKRSRMIIEKLEPFTFIPSEKSKPELKTSETQTDPIPSDYVTQKEHSEPYYSDAISQKDLNKPDCIRNIEPPRYLYTKESFGPRDSYTPMFTQEQEEQVYPALSHRITTGPSERTNQFDSGLEQMQFNHRKERILARFNTLERPSCGSVASRQARQSVNNRRVSVDGAWNRSPDNLRRGERLSHKDYYMGRSSFRGVNNPKDSFLERGRRQDSLPDLFTSGLRHNNSKPYRNTVGGLSNTFTVPNLMHKERPSLGDHNSSYVDFDRINNIKNNLEDSFLGKIKSMQRNFSSFLSKKIQEVHQLSDKNVNIETASNKGLSQRDLAPADDQSHQNESSSSGLRKNFTDDNNLSLKLSKIIGSLKIEKLNREVQDNEVKADKQLKKSSLKSYRKYSGDNVVRETTKWMEIELKTENEIDEIINLYT